MRFTSVNELDSFQFHDAELKEIKLIDHKMIWTVSHINVMTTNTQNGYLKDMCIEKAAILFEDINIEKLQFGAYEVYDANRNLIETAESVIAKPEEYQKILSESVSGYCYIFGMTELIKISDKKYRVCFDIDGGAGMYGLTFTFSCCNIKWDTYTGEAWYEHPKWKGK